MYYKKLLFSVIILLILLSNCTKQDNPFTPKDPNGVVDYNYNFHPERFNYDYNYSIWNLEGNIFSDSPYVISYKVYASWNPALPLDQWVKYTKIDTSYDQWQDDNDDPHNNYGDMLYYRVKEYLDSPFAFISNFSQPSLIEVKLGSMEEKYSFKYPTFEVTVISTNSFYLERFYRVQAVDMYGRKTGPKIISIKYCQVEAAFIHEYDSPPGSFDAASLKGGIGSVINIGINTYTIKLDFPEDILRRIWQCYNGRVKLYVIRIRDFSVLSGELIDVLDPGGSPYIINVEYSGQGDWGWNDCWEN